MKLTPEVSFTSEECRFRLETICGKVIALCTCSNHLCAYDLSSSKNLFQTPQILSNDLSITPINGQSLPGKGVDFLGFFDNIGKWFRLWYEKECWKLALNSNVKIPKESAADWSAYSTMIHSRSKCSIVYDYFPPHCWEAQVPILNIFF